jgi:arsenate reductase-like glutaredoxin family protein
MKTISGREISIKANQSKRTFTIKTSTGKYRTNKMSVEEFDSCENNTGNDWQQFLNTSSGEYYKV